MPANANGGMIRQSGSCARAIGRRERRGGGAETAGQPVQRCYRLVQGCQVQRRQVQRIPLL